jgi:Type IV secretion-system coupling protein DNA-binding domain
MNEPLRAAALRARCQLVQNIAVSLFALTAVHLAPKPFAPFDSSRWAMTVIYFIAFLWLCWQALAPLSRFLRAWYAWRFDGCHERITHAWMSHVTAVERISSTSMGTIMPFAGSTWVTVLYRWHQGLAPIAPVNTLLWLFLLFQLFRLPWRLKPLLDHEREVRLSLRHQIDRIRPDLHHAAGSDTEAANSETPPQADGRQFYAGGINWRWESLNANVVVLGESGSGKTLCVLNALLDGLLSICGRGGEKLAALILDPKGDFGGKLELLCRRLGRSADLVIVDPANPSRALERWNPLDSDDPEIELAGRFRSVLETLGLKDNQTSIWISSAEKFVRSAIALLRLTNPAGEPPRFHQIADLASSPTRLAERIAGLDETNPDVDLCLEDFAGNWIDLPHETRTSIQMMVTTMLDPFRYEPYRTFFSGKSSLRIGSMIDQGKILYVNMPTAERTEMARTVSAFVKLEYFREVLRRTRKKRPSLFFCDEFQDFFTARSGAGDASFFDKSRESNHTSVVGSQSLPNLIRRSDSDLEVKSLLGNCATKIFLRNGEADTNTFAARLFGERSFVSTSESVSIGRGLSGAASRTHTRTDQKDQIIPPEAFVQLARPDRDEGIDYCESIVRLPTGRGAGPRRLRWPVHPIEASGFPSQSQGAPDLTTQYF